MSRRSRRKTLSHAEIENFLCDLSQEQGPPSQVTTTTSTTTTHQSEGGEVKLASQSISSAEDEDRKYRAKVLRAFYQVSECAGEVVVVVVVARW